MKCFTKGGIHCISRSSLGTFVTCMRGHPMVELTEHHNSAADIKVHSMYIYVLLHSYYVIYTRA